MTYPLVCAACYLIVALAAYRECRYGYRAWDGKPRPVYRRGWSAVAGVLWPLALIYGTWLTIRPRRAEPGTKETAHG